MSGCTGCGGCASGCGGCQSHVLLLTEAEIRLLRRFGDLAFLPAACTRTNETPVYLSDLGGRAEISAAILALQVKRLISVDFALPLQGFDYAGYEDYPVRGSMALTAAGQEALDSPEHPGLRGIKTKKDVPDGTSFLFLLPSGGVVIWTWLLMWSMQ